MAHALIVLHCSVILCTFMRCFRFHTYNGTRQSETVPPNSQLAEDELWARPSPTDARTPKVNTAACW